jgi:hypothetical protein
MSAQGILKVTLAMKPGRHEKLDARTRDDEPQLLTIQEAAELAGLTQKAMRRRVERGRKAPQSPHLIHARRAPNGGRPRVLIPYSELERVGLVKDGKPVVNGSAARNGATVRQASGHVDADQLRIERERDLALEELALTRRLLADLAVASPWRRRGLLRLARERYGTHVS